MIATVKTTIATWFGAGFSPFAPGTVGAAATAPLVVLLWWIGSVPLHALAAVVLAGVGIWSAGGAEERWGRKDPGQVVIDEVAGFLVATAMLPPHVGLLVAAFFIFRLLDVVKPWPCRRLELLEGGWGIMLDDLVAGLYTNLLLQGWLLLWRALT